MKKRKKILPFHLFADAQPSEAIQQDELPGLAVSCILPYKPEEHFLDVPVQQYKSYEKSRKADRAKRLADWLRAERENGLVITGFLMSLSVKAAATYGLDLIEELPGIQVKPHYRKYRLYFGKYFISFSQSVALMYYSFVLNFSVLRASSHMRADQRYMHIFLDNLPGASPGKLKPGERPTGKSPGMKFIEYVRNHSKTAIEIDKANSEKGIQFKTDSLLWFEHPRTGKTEPGKKHPSFTLVDWVSASARAHHFRQDFIDTFSTEETGVKAADAMNELYLEFKNFDIWEVANDDTLAHIKSNEKLWIVPDDARDYIMNLATEK